MKIWPVKIETPNFGICEVRETTDEETSAANRKNINYAPSSHGFVNLFQEGKFVGWCGIAWAKRQIIGGLNQKLPKYIRDIPI